MPIPTTAEAFKIAASGGLIDAEWGHLSRWLVTEGV